MKIQFLGTGAAEGVPAMFCNCDFCNSLRSGESALWRTRSQVIINDEMSIDFPPEAYYHSLKFGVSLTALKYAIISHSHMDHFYAHDFILRGYKYGKLLQEKLEIYGNSEVLKVFSECTAREMKPEVAQNISCKLLLPLNEYKIGDYRVLTLPASHSKTEQALLFFIENGGKGYLHLYDTGLFDGGSFNYLKKMGAKADLVTFDCTFLDGEGGEGARHMGIIDNMKIKDRLISSGVCDENTRYFITHFSHNSRPSAERIAEVENSYGVTAAYDGKIVEI